MERSPLTPRPLVYAHRGDRSRADDNTVEAFDLAVEAGADGIELDVRRTLDGILIVSHDPSIGDLPPFDQLRFDELRAASPKVPTFEEVLARIPREVFLNVEVKHDPIEPSPDPDRNLAAETVAMITAHDEPDRVILSSFDPPTVERFGVEAPTMLRGQLVAGGMSFSEAIALTVQLGADALHPPMAALAEETEDRVAEAHSLGVAVVVWNANTPDEVATAARAGIDVIITDDPGMARDVVG